jgi:putative glycosyltransferase (TIGR04348 family)
LTALSVEIVTPAPARSRKGNRVTALRWARILRALGHRVTVRQEHRAGAFDLLVALHALKSAPSVERFRRTRPAAPLVLALTGTDLYQEIHRDPAAVRSMELATRLVVLQPGGVAELPETLRPKTRVILQSAAAPREKPAPSSGTFDVCVLGHLREVKDPFRAALAARRLSPSSRVVVLHAGAALDDAMRRRAESEASSNPRYRWLGELPHAQALATLARSRLLVQSSLLEGGANSISEAIAASVPVLSSRIPGSVGLLGADYPGLFPVEDTEALASLLARAESDARFYGELRERCARLAPLLDPEREKESWRALLAELTPP